ncbi:MAG: hypothetical protein IKY87_04015 [Paludibacteraceae bacterium]|nr:hypothetical protein [Paludibacteraceae bacterium]
MATIQIVSNLKLHPQKGLLSKDSTGKWIDVHHQQGDLDGACAVYSVIMNLLILGMIEKEEICVYSSIDKRTRKGKLLSCLLEKQGLVRDGYCFRTLAKDIRDYANFTANQKLAKSREDAINIIQKSIENDSPIIISVFGEEWAHALLAIGIEYNENDIPTKILCLDPGVPSPIYTYWNCIIDVSTKTLWYKTEKSQTKAELGDLLVISQE